MRLDKCDAYTAKKTLVYKGRKTYVAAKREENQRGTGGETNNQSSPIWRREEPMEKQKRVSEGKDRNTRRQETAVVTRREKVGEGGFRKIGTQREITTKPKPV